MSQTTTTPLKTAPAAANAVSVPSGGSAWAPGAWVEVLAATGSAAAIAGLVCLALPPAEIDVGVGAAGSEAVVTTFRLTFAGSGWAGPNVAWLLRPVTGIASGARIALRHRNSAGGQTAAVALCYYEGLDGTNSLALPSQVLPAAATGVAVTPNGTAWANSAYVTLTTGLGTPVALLALVFPAPIATIDGEWDLATGSAGAEVVITTLRFAASSFNNAGGLLQLLLPAPYPLAAATRVAIRVRTSGTTTTAYSVALLYDESTPAPTVGPHAEPFLLLPV